MSNELTQLDLSRIKRHNYTQTLLDEGLRTGMLQDSDAQRISVWMEEQIEDLIGRASGGESTSVMTETAAVYAASVLFVLDTQLLSLETPEEAVAALRGEPLNRLYEDGCRRLRNYQLDAASLLVKARRIMAPVPNRSYRRTLNKDLSAAIDNYNMLFSAQIGAKFEYPLALPVQNLRGIYQILAYVSSLHDENLFCREYDGNQIAIVCGIRCEARRVKVETAFMNIYSAIFVNALICDYLRHDHGSLLLRRADCDVAYRLLEPFDDEEREGLLRSVVNRFTGGNPDYNIRYFESILPDLLNALRYNRLHNQVILVPDDGIIDEDFADM